MSISLGGVDKDTEFFSERGWVKICDFTSGNKVMQYNPNTDMAEFVIPDDYIKEPCSKFFLFSNGKNLEQCFAEDGKMLLWHKNGKKIDYIDASPKEANRFATGKKKFFIKNIFKISSEGIPVKNKEIEDLACHRLAYKLIDKDTVLLNRMWSASPEQLNIIIEINNKQRRYIGLQNFGCHDKQNKDFMELLQYAYLSNGLSTNVDTVSVSGNPYIYYFLHEKKPFSSLVKPNIVYDESAYKYRFCLKSGYMVIRRNYNISVIGC